MATKIGSLFYEIYADSSKLNKGLSESKSGVSKLADGFKSLTGISLSAAGAITAVASGLKFAINEAIEAEVAETRLNTVLESTGHAAGMTKDALMDMATGLSKVTMYSEETIMDAESLLLTFTKVGKDVFPAATKAALNMSAAFGQDLQSSVIQLGKALNDPSGMAAMKRIGVSFSDAQIEMAKAMFETGDVAGYQRLILKELNTEVGGMARAMGTTYAGQVVIFKNQLGELGETAGKIVIPDLLNMVKILNALLEGDITSIRVIAMEEDLKNLNRAFRNGTLDIEEYKILVGEVQDKISALTGEVFTTSTAMEDYFTASELAAMGMGTVAEATIDATEAVDDYGKTMLSLTGSIQRAEERYTETYERLTEERKELMAEQATATGERLAEINADLDENERALQDNVDAHTLAKNTIMLGYLEQLLAADGLTTEEANMLLEQGVKWGVYSQTAVDEMREVMIEMGLLADNINGLPTAKSFTYTLYGEIDPSYHAARTAAMDGVVVDPSIRSLELHRNHDINGNGIIGGATGLSMRVPPGYPDDSFKIGATSGETVNIGRGGDRMGSQSFDYDRLARLNAKYFAQELQKVSR